MHVSLCMSSHPVNQLSFFIALTNWTNQQTQVIGSAHFVCTVHCYGLLDAKATVPHEDGRKQKVCHIPQGQGRPSQRSHQAKVRKRTSTAVQGGPQGACGGKTGTDRDAQECCPVRSFEPQRRRWIPGSRCSCCSPRCSRRSCRRSTPS